MKLEDILIDENLTIKDAAEQLERVRCKVVYVVEGRKLKASLSDGDIRRFVSKNGDINSCVLDIANDKPHYLLEINKSEYKERFENSELYSVPVINLNREVVSIIFKSGKEVNSYKLVDIPVVIMAGGKGTRLYPYTKILPKALIPIGDVPITERIINEFQQYGINKYYMVLNHKKNMIEAYFDSIDKQYTVEYVEEHEPLGTGGGLSLLKDKISTDFILTNCDVLVDADYGKIREYHITNKNFITIVAAEYSHNIPYGVINTTSEDGEMQYESVSEKPAYKYIINTGVYVVDKAVVEEMKSNESIGFPQIIDNYKMNGKKIGVYTVAESAYMDMGQLEELDKMRNKLNIK